MGIFRLVAIFFYVCAALAIVASIFLGGLYYQMLAAWRTCSAADNEGCFVPLEGVVYHETPNIWAILTVLSVVAALIFLVSAAIAQRYGKKAPPLR